MRRTSIAAFALALLAAAGLAGAARAEDEGSLRFEKTVPFQRDHLINLGAKVGPVKISQVTFATGGSGGGGGIGDTIRARVHGGDTDTLTNLTAAFDSENPKDQEWVVTYTIELLDADGKLIDRFSRKESFEGEADVVKAERSILTYVVPMIAKVRIKLEAALD
ncbi:MAG TPA: hypothetical protein VGS57_17720 [Thermoanaerobaculia bacterium]|jgi:hypothetical protein|nr:hypothetical protein [Thermoanaerobaculia bacterium]